jgi:hypothetical protein
MSRGLTENGKVSEVSSTKVAKPNAYVVSRHKVVPFPTTGAPHAVLVQERPPKTPSANLPVCM